MLGILDALWRVVDFLAGLWDLIRSWRVILPILVAMGLVFLLRQFSVTMDPDACLIAAFIGFVTGLAWELLSAAAGRGYI